jgi:hypothetical protein
LSPGDDDPLADRYEYTAYGYTFLENLNPPPNWIAHGANVGLRLLSNPDNYIDTKISDEQTGYYFFYIGDLDDGYYVVDGSYSNATTEWFGTSTSFHWESGNPSSFACHIYMYEQ